MAPGGVLQRRARRCGDLVRRRTDGGGRQIAAGEVLWVSLGAANRDPSAFEDPNTVDAVHGGNPHLSFGRGIHFCLGSHLARLDNFDKHRAVHPTWRSASWWEAEKPPVPPISSTLGGGAISTVWVWGGR